MSAITISGVAKTFQGRSGLVRALDPIDLNIEAGEFICLVGPSGCGKSTLLFIIAGLTKSTDGKVLSNGRMVSGPGPDRTVVFQSDAVFPWMTVSENIGYGLRFKRTSRSLQSICNDRNFVIRFGRIGCGGGNDGCEGHFGKEVCCAAER
jgi:NitT/TauT family transport system ATP-binding protein